jgi:hypothetical protein
MDEGSRIYRPRCNLPMYTWLGKEMILLSFPPRRTVRTRHRVYGSSHRRTPGGALVL